MGLYSAAQRGYFLYEVYSGLYMVDHFHKVWLNTVVLLMVLTMSLSCWYYLPHYLLVVANFFWLGPPTSSPSQGMERLVDEELEAMSVFGDAGR